MSIPQESRPLHSSLFAVEFDASGTAVDPELGSIAVLLADRVITTLRNQLVRTTKRLTAFQLTEVPDTVPFDIATLVCEIDGNVTLPPTTFWDFDIRRVRKNGERPAPSTLANLCLKGVQKVLETIDLYYRDQESEVFLSGPEPVWRDDLAAEVAALPLCEAPVPPSAEAYVTDLTQVCNTIFGRVTWGALPRIACTIETGEL